MIGIIPAAGKAERMGGIPKMLLPIPGGTLIDLMIRRMKLTRIAGQPFIVSCYPVADLLEIHTGDFVFTAQTQTMSETVLTVDIARDKVDVIFGMPDTFFDDEQAFVKLTAALDCGADVAVGIFRARWGQHRKLGMVNLNGFAIEGARVTEVIDKPEEPNLVFAWGVLAWKPLFWPFIKAEDPHVGYALPRAIEAGLDVRAVRMEGEYFDCGTPDEYFECIEHLRRKA